MTLTNLLPKLWLNLDKIPEVQSYKEPQLSFCGLKCTTFLHFKTYHPEEMFLFIPMSGFVERDLSICSYFL